MVVRTRASRRYRASLPIEISSNGRVEAFCTYAMSANGCIVCGDKPVWLADKCDVRVLTPSGASIDVQGATVHVRGRAQLPELHLEWALRPNQANELVQFLQTSDVEPSADAKASFLADENQLIHAEILHIEDHRRSGYQSLFLLVGAYFAFTVAPFKLFERSVMSIEVMVFYAIAGLWLSTIVLFQSNRFLAFLASSVRRRVHLYKALASNRGWLFAHDPHYFAKSVMPLSAHFDGKRAWRVHYADESEKHAQWVTYNLSSVYFHAFLQVFFVLGTLFFLSLMLRAYDLRIIGGEHFVKAKPEDTLDLFKMEYFRWAVVCFAMVPIGWIQMITNRAAAYRKRLWEARRISATRPNPRFVDRAFSVEQPKIHLALEIGAKVFIALVSAVGLIMLYPPFRRDPHPHMQGIISWQSMLAVSIIFMLVKRLHTDAIFRAAGRTDEQIMPLRAFEQK